MEKSVFETLFEINVNDHVEKKNGLSYLSWPYVWSEVKNRFTEANYKVSETEYGCIYFTDGCVAALAKSRPNPSALDKSSFTRKGLNASESTQGLDKLISRNGSGSNPLERNLPLGISMLAMEVGILEARYWR